MSQPRQNPQHQFNIAVLIDGDNAQPKLFEKILLEVARYGRPTIRRIYGDWTAANMSSWKTLLHDHAIAPVQQFRNTIGKNATDSTLIIDAMDILYSQSVRCFCIVSSDSDYTRLATRIREDGIMFIGIGKKCTPQAFVKACDVFIYTEILSETSEVANSAVAKPAVATGPVKADKAVVPANPAAGLVAKAKVNDEKKPKKLAATPAKKVKSPPPVKMLQKAFAMSVQEDGWAHMGAMGLMLRQIDPGFDPRTWGYTQLSQMVGAVSKHFTIKKSSGPNAGGNYIKLKEQKNQG